MRAADTNTILVKPGEKSKQLCAFNSRRFGSKSRPQFGIIVHNGGCIDDQIRASDVFGALPKHNIDAHGTLKCERVGFIVVGACNFVSPLLHDLYKRKHTGSANAYKMDLPCVLKDFLI